MSETFDTIPPEVALNLSGALYQRIQRSAQRTALTYYDADIEQWLSYTWEQVGQQVGRWQALFRARQYQPGDHIAIMIKNCPEWVFCEQAALGLGLVVVPLYTNDRADSVGYILDDAEIKFLLIENGEQWLNLHEIKPVLQKLDCIVSLNSLGSDEQYEIKALTELLPDSAAFTPFSGDKNSLASIVYTSGTTGKPKGVMLTHHNILTNAYAATQVIPCKVEHQFLSFLPLSHMFERTAGYYVPLLAGASITYARSIQDLAEDLQIIKPSIIVTVPRIFERVHNKIKSGLKHKGAVAKTLFDLAVNVGWRKFLWQQKREPWTPALLLAPLLHKVVGEKVMAKLGGNMELAIAGGAPLSPEIARTFIGLGLTISQGYGLTECAPVISTNALEDNDPFSVGRPLPNLEVAFSDSGELLIRGSSVMQGYWKKPEDTRQTITDDHWLRTGDKAKLVHNHLYITGRLKEIIVLSNGEKVPPADMELAIAADPLIEQVMIVGEGRPYLSALVVLNADEWPNLARDEGLDPNQEASLNNKLVKEIVNAHLSQAIHAFPGYAKIHKVSLSLEPWCVDNGLLTPTLKLKRHLIAEKFQREISAMYQGH